MTRIKQLRKKKKLTQKQLAKLSGLPLLTVGRIERGECSPRLENATKIASALEVPLEALVEKDKEA